MRPGSSFLLFLGVLLLAFGASGCSHNGSVPAPDQIGDIVIPPELYAAYQKFKADHDIVPTDWIELQRTAAHSNLATRRAFIYIEAEYLYNFRSYPGYKLHGLKAIDYAYSGDGHEADARAIAQQIGFTYDGAETNSADRAHRLLDDREYTLGELASMADTLLQQYRGSFDLIIPWGDSGYGHDEGFGSSF